MNKCWNRSQHVWYPEHEIDERGRCMLCGSWFAVGEDDEFDESKEYATEEEANEASA